MDSLTSADPASRITLLDPFDGHQMDVSGYVDQNRDEVAVQETRMLDWEVWEVVASVDGECVVAGPVRNWDQDVFSMAGKFAVLEVYNER